MNLSYTQVQLSIFRMINMVYKLRRSFHDSNAKHYISIHLTAQKIDNADAVLYFLDNTSSSPLTISIGFKIKINTCN